MRRTVDMPRRTVDRGSPPPPTLVPARYPLMLNPLMFRSTLIAGLFWIIATAASAQTVLTNDPFELFIGKGTSALLLPDYEAGVSSGGGEAFEDDLDELAYGVQILAVRRFLHTRTSFETRLNFNINEANTLATPGDISFANPGTGVTETLSGGRANLEADAVYYGFDTGLRDTWRTRLGGLSAGLTFSYFAIDQDFQATYNGADVYEEELNSDFLGGKGFVGWERMFGTRPISVDLWYGYFNVDAEYDFRGQSIGGISQREFSDHTSTAEIWVSTRQRMNNGTLGLAFGGTYITDMPSLIQDQGATMIGTDDAGTLNALIQWIW